MPRGNMEQECHLAGLLRGPLACQAASALLRELIAPQPDEPTEDCWGFHELLAVRGRHPHAPSLAPTAPS